MKKKNTRVQTKRLAGRENRRESRNNGEIREETRGELAGPDCDTIVAGSPRNTDACRARPRHRFQRPTDPDTTQHKPLEEYD